MENNSNSDDSDSGRLAALSRRQQVTDALASSPYDLMLYLRRAVIYSELGYPDLAAGDAYRALLLTDEARNETSEYHQQATEAVQKYPTHPLPDVLDHGALASARLEASPDLASQRVPEPASSVDLVFMATVRSYQILSLNLLLCGCLRGAYQLCERGLSAMPDNKELSEIRGYITKVAQSRLRGHPEDAITAASLPEWGLARREVYPWNNHETDRTSPQSLAILNAELARVAPKCAVQVAELPVLLDSVSDTDGYSIIPTTHQLGLFAKEDIEPGEVVLQEYSLLTANNRLKESTCDACGTELPSLGEDSHAISCPQCQDAVFCDEFCYLQAQEQYHPAVCDKDVDAIAKDPEAGEADQALYLLLLARLLAMAAHQDLHPLEVKEVKFIWGDFVPSRSNDIDPSPNADPPPDWTLPFSFRHNIETPLHILERMDLDIFQTLAQYDVWIFNTLYAKFRGTASARKSRRDGRPEVAAVHPLWCLANHDCDPNVQWEWGGRMVLWAREQSVTGKKPPGIRAGHEVLNHYCDINLPAEQRREWAKGSLGGLCMCQRCRDELAAKQDEV
jgi:hypothetical protein